MIERTGECTLFPEPPIDDGIEENDHATQDHLDFSSESIRIEDREQVMREEVVAIANLARLFPQPILQRSQRTDPATQFYDGAPGGSRYVQPDHAPPLQGK